MAGGIAVGMESASRRSFASALEWPARYAARRIAWHVLDHAWEIEDRSDPASRTCVAGGG